MTWLLLIYVCAASGCIEASPIPQPSPEACVETRQKFLASPITQLKDGYWGEARCSLENRPS